MKEMDYVGRKLRRLMDDRGISIRKLAKMTGLAKRTIELALSSPEGRTLETMQKIAQALEVPLNLLLSPDPIPGWLLQGGSKGKEVEVSVRVPKSFVDRLRKTAKELEQEPDEWICTWLSDVISMHRYLCPECNRSFAAETDAKYCPYCGANFEETIDEPIVQ